MPTRPLHRLVAAAIAGSAVVACSSTSLAPLPGQDAGAADSSVADAGASDAAPDVAVEASTVDAAIGGCSTSRDSGNFPAFADACTSDHDCVLVLHQLDCCGSLEAVGINVVARNYFDADESIWRSSCPACGCAAQPTFAQDGNTGSISSIFVTCAGAASGSGVCRTYVHM